MTARASFALALLALLSLTAHAELLPGKGHVDPRIRVAPYDPDQVYRLQGFVGYQIDLEFAPGEHFVGLGAGDVEGIAFSAEENHLFLKPKAAHVQTNLTVITNLRHYQFDYTATWHHPDPNVDEVIYALKFLYPPKPEDPTPGLAASRAAHIDSALKHAGERVRNTDYWYCGSEEVRPVAASDDGVHTRLAFAPNTELPAIFVESDDGAESLVNFSVEENGDVIVHRIAHRFVLRRGKLTGCIVNKGFEGSGLRLPNGTVSPSVERVTKGAPR